VPPIRPAQAKGALQIGRHQGGDRLLTRVSLLEKTVEIERAKMPFSSSNTTARTGRPQQQRVPPSKNSSRSVDRWGLLHQRRQRLPETIEAMGFPNRGPGKSRAPASWDIPHFAHQEL